MAGGRSESLGVSSDRFAVIDGSWLLPKPLISPEIYEPVGPRRIEGWLRRTEDMNFVFSLENCLADDLRIGRLHPGLAVIMFGHGVLNLKPGDCPKPVWVTSGVTYWE